MQKVSKELEWIAQDMKTWAYYDREELEKRDAEIVENRLKESIARRMLSREHSIEEVSMCTGLTIEEVEEIQSEM